MLEDNSFLFRYMALQKAISLFVNKALYFCRVDLLEDYWEGIYLDDFIQDIKKIIKTISKGKTEKELNETVSYIKEFRKLMYVNCWCQNSHELISMWGNYSGSKDGIAIQTTVRKLKNVLDEAQENIRIDKVHYIEYENSSSVPGCSASCLNYEQKSRSMIIKDEYSAFLYKRHYFKDECEVRCLLYKDELLNEKNDFPRGIHIPVNLNNLIDTVYIDPRMPKPFADDIKKLIKMYGNFDVKQSPIAMLPSSYPYAESIK